MDETKLLGKITIDRRFRGPPNSANGGYACGRLAAFMDGPAEVTLRKPPPLETELSVIAEPGGSIALYDGELLIASARPQDVEPDALVAPTYEEALAASARTFDASKHKLPMCFVCGPHRDPGDGLRIFCGPLDAADSDWTGIVAAPFTAEAYTADDSGYVSPEFIWAALDCPTAYAAGSPEGFPTILLGRQCVSIHDRPQPGEKCTIAAHQTGRDGRKYLSRANLFSADGRPLAYCQATWIEVPREVQLGSD